LILSCVVTSLDKFHLAFALQNISKVVDFISLYSWDLEGPWSNRTDFGNAIKSERLETLTLVLILEYIQQYYLLTSIQNLKKMLEAKSEPNKIFKHR